MNNRIYLSCFVLCYLLFIALKGFSQPAQYDNIPANLSTGGISVDLPLWTASSGSLSLPVFLNYANNGLRITDKPTETGIGWKLIAGGHITRLVRGEEGDIPTFQNIGVPIDNSYLRDVAERGTDAEPDVYAFEFAGYSGQFYIYASGKACTLSEDGLIIDILQGSDAVSVNYFHITDSKGIRYIFGRQKTTEYWDDFANNDPNHKIEEYKWGQLHSYNGKQEHQTYLLTKIINAQGTDSIMIDYPCDPLKPLIGDGLPVDSTILCMGEEDGIEVMDKQASLVSIRSRNETIVLDIEEISNELYPDYLPFNTHLPNVTSLLSTNEHFTNRQRMLNNIKVFTKNDSLVKEYDFKYFVSGQVIMLTEITEKGSRGGAMPPYKFTYNGVFVRSKWYDYWGYANSYTSGATMDTDKGRYPVPGYAEKGMLKSITYPTGATIEYFYEPNTYSFPVDHTDKWYDGSWNNILDTLTQLGIINENKNNLTGPGVRIKRIVSRESSNGDSLVTEFSYNDEYGSSGRLSHYPVFGYYYPFVDLQDPSQSSIKYLRSSEQFGLEPGYVGYQKITIFHGGKIPGTQNGGNGKTENFYQSVSPVDFGDGDFPFPVKVYEKQFNGKLTRSYVYDKNNKLVSARFAQYDTSSTESTQAKGLKTAIFDQKRLISGTVETNYQFREYFLMQKRQQLKKITNRSYFGGDSTYYTQSEIIYNYTRNGKSRLLPTEILTLESNGDTLVTKLFYPEDDEFLNIPACKKMIEKNINSPVLKEETFRNGQLLSGSKTIYKLLCQNGDTLIVPEESQVWIDGDYEPQSWFDKYDADYGLLLQSHGRDQLNNTVLYAYGGMYAVANIVNLDYQTISGIIDPLQLRDSYDNVFIESTLNTLRSAIEAGYPQVYINSAIYKPLVGKLKESDANDRATTFGYDEFGRLIGVWDANGVLRSFKEYNLRK